MIKIKQYDTVILKNGKRAVIVEVLSEDTFIADIGDSPEDWDSIDVKLEEIKEVLYESRYVDCVGNIYEINSAK